jgi:ribosomal small subunit protein bTHX
MGKGDIKTRRGKLFNGSFGVRRPRKISRPGLTDPGEKKTAGKDL